MIDNLANKIRYKICEVSHLAKTPHIGSCLSCIDLLLVLYWHVLNIDPNDPNNTDRDYFLLSKGHAASALYTVLAYRGFFPVDSLLTHGQDGSPFEEHPGIDSPAGVENVSGSLGHALSIATGMALTAKIKKMENKFYVLVGDGELNEGSIWEAAQFAAAKCLNNLILIIDFNKLQGTGSSCDIMSLEPLHEKWQSFSWHTIRVNGHNEKEILSAFEGLERIQKPICVIADTIKGKGVSFMENDNNWHYRIPVLDELDLIAEELEVNTK